MKNVSKYGVQYFAPKNPPMRWAKRDHVEKAPVWCSVDLRDGNQALVVPMSLDEKIEFFEALVKVGFKEIEVGFPAASETEYQFLRTLIERDLIPDDVTVQVLTQSREHIVRKTYEALRGVKYDGYKVVEGRSVRKYTDEAAVAEAVAAEGKDPYERKLRGITDMTALLGKKEFERILGSLIYKPSGKPVLVRDSDRRPEYNTAKSDFEE